MGDGRAGPTAGVAEDAAGGGPHGRPAAESPGG